MHWSDILLLLIWGPLWPPYVTLCFMLHPIAWGCEKESENLPSAQKIGYLKRGMAGEHLPSSHRDLLQLSASSSPSGTRQWLLPWQGWCCGQIPQLCSVCNLMGPHSRPLGATIILALLSHNNNKGTCFMRISRGLEKAVSAGKGTQSFLAWKLPGELQGRLLRPGARSLRWQNLA